MSASSQLRRVVPLLSLAIAAFAVGGAGVSGQSGTAIRISPPNFEISVEPGEVVAQQMRVSNRGGSPVLITMEVAGFRPQGQEGQVELTEQEEAEFGILTWTSVSPSEFLLEPGQEEAVTFLIEVDIRDTIKQHVIIVAEPLNVVLHNLQLGQTAVHANGFRLSRFILFAQLRLKHSGLF